MIHTHNNYHVIIVGGGPAGSTTAYQLSKLGLKVLIIEAEKKITRKVCGEFLCAEGVATLKQIGLFDIIEKNQFLPSYGAKIVTTTGCITKSTFPVTAEHTVGGYCLNRQIFDDALLQEAQTVGSSVLMGEWVSDIQPQTANQQNTGWTVTLRSGKTYTCDLLIGADGKRSTVAKKLGLTKPLKNKRLALRCFLPTINVTERTIEMHLLTAGDYIGIDVVENNEVNFSVVTDEYSIKKHGSKEGLIRYYFKQHPHLNENIILPDDFPKIEAISPVSHHVKSCIAQNIVLLGDAGGFIEPLTGEGIAVALWTSHAFISNIKEVINCNAWHKRQECLAAYQKQKNKHYFQKKLLAKVLYKVIRHPKLCDGLYYLIGTSEKRRQAFMGIINNIYTPLGGLRRMVFS